MVDSQNLKDIHYCTDISVALIIPKEQKYMLLTFEKNYYQVTKQVTQMI